MWIDAMHPGLLADILEHPDDDTPRLVLADWLDEQGQPERAEFIQVQCKLASASERNCGGYYCDVDLETGACIHRSGCRWHPLCRRERELLGAHYQEWAALAGFWEPYGAKLDECRVYTGGPEPYTYSQVVFRRGFIEEVFLPCQQWLKHGPELVRCQPIQRVRLSDREPVRFRAHGDGPWQWCWFDEDCFETDERASFPDILPQLLFGCFESRPAMVARFPSSEAAHAALSHACLLWANEQARQSTPLPTTC